MKWACLNESVLHEISDGGRQLLPRDRRHPRRLHQELRLVVRGGDARGRGDALHLAAGVQHVVHGQLEPSAEVPVSAEMEEEEIKVSRKFRQKSTVARTRSGFPSASS